MASSDSDYHPTTPPPAPAKRTRRRTAKALEALPQPATARASAGRSTRIEGGATAVQLSQNDGSNGTQQHPAHTEPPPSPARRAATSAVRVRDGGIGGIGELAELIASFQETIAQQNSIIANQNRIIEDIRSDRATFQAEQQHLKDQIAELQETIGSLRAQLDTLSIESPSTQTWASVAASGQPASSGTTPS